MTTTGASIPVIHSDAHRGHDGLLEVQDARLIDCWETPRRVDEIERALRATGGFRFLEADEFGSDPILAVHAAELLAVIDAAWDDGVAAGELDGSRPLIPDTFKLAGYAGPMQLGQLPGSAHRRLGAFCFDTATPMVAGTAAAARAAVDVALTAASLVAADAPLAYALCRPPGHHAGRAMLGGYCFFNNAAIAAEWLRREAGTRSVVIVDIDYHHGNGTQQLFWERPDIFYLSLHADPLRAYPYFSGFASERGAGQGRDTTMNLPLARGIGIDGYAAALADGLARVGNFDPDAPLIVSLGFDTFERDPIGDLALRVDDYGELGRMLGALERPTLVVQEGGYAVDALGAMAVAFFAGLRDGAARRSGPGSASRDLPSTGG